MSDVLGIRRVFFVLLAIGLNALLVSIVYGYLGPQQRVSEQDVRIIRGEIFDLQNDIEQMRVEFSQLQEQQEQFEELLESGFFEFQGRREAQSLFEQIQKRTNVIKAAATISAGELVQNDLAEKAGHELLVSPVSLDIKAYDDIDVYKYLYLLERSFPGNIMVDSMYLKRDADLDAIVLRGIAGGEDIGLISADVDFTWRTMVPKSDQIFEGGDGQ